MKEGIWTKRILGREKSVSEGEGGGVAAWMGGQLCTGPWLSLECNATWLKRLKRVTCHHAYVSKGLFWA